MNNKLRTFKLIDREGYLSSSSSNSLLIKEYLKDGCFTGYMDWFGELVEEGTDKELITNREFRFFKEVLPEENLPTNQNLSTQEPLSEDIGAKMRNHLKEDAKQTGGSLYVDGDAMYFLWEGSEYHIEEEGDYQKIIDSIKVLLSFRG